MYFGPKGLYMPKIKYPTPVYSSTLYTIEQVVRYATVPTSKTNFVFVQQAYTIERIAKYSRNQIIIFNGIIIFEKFTEEKKQRLNKNNNDNQYRERQSVATEYESYSIVKH